MNTMESHDTSAEAVISNDHGIAVAMTTTAAAVSTAAAAGVEDDATLLLMDHHNEACMREIEAAVKQDPLTSIWKPLSSLESQYHPTSDVVVSTLSSSLIMVGSNFLAGLRSLQQEYAGIRTIRGDGNCYYRAFLYCLAESLVAPPPPLSSSAGSSSPSNKTNKTSNNKMNSPPSPQNPEQQRILHWIKKDSWEQVLHAGYDEMTLEAFYDTIVELLEGVATGNIDAAQLHAKMNEETATSDYCTWYLRVITATKLKQEPDRFLPFVDQPGLDIAQFCQREVEPMGKECEQVQVLALAEAFGVQVHIEYLDGHDLVNGKVTNHIFGPDDAATRITLLYRPGHYDILYASPL